MSRYYLWKGHAPVIAVDQFYLNAYRHAYVYDTFSGPPFRWQVLFKSKLTKRTKEQMPKEFLMHLLLLGVPT